MSLLPLHFRHIVVVSVVAAVDVSAVVVSVVAAVDVSAVVVVFAVVGWCLVVDLQGIRDQNHQF